MSKTLFREWPTAGFKPPTTDFLTPTTPHMYVFYKTPTILRTVCASWAKSGLGKNYDYWNEHFPPQLFSKEFIKDHSVTAKFSVTNLKILNLSENITWSRKDFITKFTLPWNFFRSHFFGSNQKYQQDGLLAPVYLSPNYKYFDQLLQTVKNKTTLLILVFKEFLQTSLPPLISVLYAKGYHVLPLKNFRLKVP